MIKYSGNSYYLIVKIIFLIFSSILIGYVISKPNTPDKGFYLGVFLILVFLFFIVKFLKNLIIVNFTDTDVIIKYLIIGKSINIPYSSLLMWHCIDGQRGYHINIIEFEIDTFKDITKRKIKIDRIVDNNKFIPFLKWIKSKNDNIKIKITPLDSKLLKPFYQEFGSDN